MSTENQNQAMLQFPDFKSKNLPCNNNMLLQTQKARGSTFTLPIIICQGRTNPNSDQDLGAAQRAKWVAIQ